MALERFPDPRPRQRGITAFPCRNPYQSRKVMPTLYGPVAPFVRLPLAALRLAGATQTHLLPSAN